MLLKRFCVVMILLFGIAGQLSLTAAMAQPSRDPQSWKWVNPDIAENCKHGTVFSQAMSRDVGYSIYLPPSYETETNKRYPVVYYLHGASGSEASSKELSWAIEKALKEKAIQEAIFVFPNGGHYSGYRDWDEGNVKSETWIIKELIPFIDAKYRTLARRESRALSGWSMGGGGSIRFLMKYPQMFCAAATISAAINHRGTEGDDSAEANLKRKLAQIKGNVSVWMAVGTEDFLRNGNVKFSELLDKHEIPHTFHQLEGVNHNLGIMSQHYHREILTMLSKSLQGESTDQKTSQAETIQEIRNVAYKLNPETDYEHSRCRLDWYLPANQKDFATLVWFHGGSIQSGDKAGKEHVELARRFAGEGVAVASINYRLSPKVNFPAYIEDAAAAVAYVLDHVSEQGGNARRVFVSGHSAGGYLTAMVGMDEQFLQAHGHTSRDVAGFIPVAGQMITHSTVRKERGIPRTQPVIDQAAPSFHVSSEKPPFLCVVGSDDLPVRAEENMLFVAAMKAAGHQQVRYLEVEGRNHSTIANQLSQPEDVVAREILSMIGASEK